MGDHLVTNEEAIEISAENDGRVERFGKYGRYSKSEREESITFSPNTENNRLMWHCWIII